jgi:hypothetical protein
VYRVAGKLWLALPTAVGSFVRLTFTFVITFLEPIEGLIAFKEKDEWMFYLCLTLATIVSQTTRYTETVVDQISFKGRYMGDFLVVLSPVEQAHSVQRVCV